MQLFHHSFFRSRFCHILALGLALTGCGPMTFVVGVSPGDQTIKATVVEESGQWFSPRVAIIDVTGTIINAHRRQLITQGDNPVELLHEKLELAHHDPAVKAIILRLNTPGGSVGASHTMYSMLQRFKKRSSKPIIALMMDVTASGGYYLACAADTIIAYPTTITGSIGVIVQTISLKPALNRLGIHTEALTTGPNKDAGSPLSTLTDEHRAVLRTLIDDFYQRFLDVVRQARPGIAPDRFAQATDGRVVTGGDALEIGLVDHLGDIYTAFDLAKQHAGIEHADLILYHRPMQHVASPYASAPPAHTPFTATATQTQINLAQFNFTESLARPPVQFYYLWQPQ